MNIKKILLRGTDLVVFKEIPFGNELDTKEMIHKNLEQLWINPEMKKRYYQIIQESEQKFDTRQVILNNSIMIESMKNMFGARWEILDLNLKRNNSDEILEYTQLDLLNSIKNNHAAILDLFQFINNNQDIFINKLSFVKDGHIVTLYVNGLIIQDETSLNTEKIIEKSIQTILND